MDLLNDVGYAKSTYHDVILQNGFHQSFPKNITAEPLQTPVDNPWYQKTLNTEEIVISVNTNGMAMLEPELILSQKLKDRQGKTVGASAIHFKLPPIFSNTHALTSDSIYRNSNIEGFLLTLGEGEAVNVIESQKRDYNSPSLVWNIPFLPDVLENKKAVVQKIKDEVLVKKRILIVKTKFKDEGYLWAFAPVGGGNIILAALTPLDSVLAQVDVVTNVGERLLMGQQKRFMLVWLISVFFAAIIAVFTSSMFVRRLKKLSTSLDLADEGKPFVYEHENAGDEISDLSHKIELFIRHQKEER